MRLFPAVLCLLLSIAGSAGGQDKKNVVVVKAKPDYYVPAENIPYYLEHLKTEARRNGGTPELKAEIERWERLAALAAMTQEGIRMFLSGTDVPPFTFYTDAEKDLPKFLEPEKRTSAQSAAIAVIYEVWNTPIWINAISSRTQNAYEEYRSGRTPSSKKTIPYQA
ncbi:hypothetical protein C4571_02875 [Candidatus Parcubacteria bacterium]|nr:MAG: hypothetical protein C4571_02875 [Candidatus Parcubacteria bacterium]